MWPFKKAEPKVGGFMASANLIDWWIGGFSEEERKYIILTFQPMGLGGDGKGFLVDGPSVGRHSDPSHLLYNLAGWFKKESDRIIAYKILEKAEELLSYSPNPLTNHFTYQTKAEIYYRWRDLDDFALEKAIEACRQQISIANEAATVFLDESSPSGLGFLPAHHGFKQLAIILEKDGKFEEALKLCEKAKLQGWNGDWDARLTRLRKKLAKRGQP
jgi:tetratricopeptide (TPR) repeat protein